MWILALFNVEVKPYEFILEYIKKIGWAPKMEHLSNWDYAWKVLGNNTDSVCKNGDAWPGVVAQIFWIKCVFWLYNYQLG